MGPSGAQDDGTAEGAASFRFGAEFLSTLDGGTAVAYRGEPTASELALLQWRMTGEEHQAFVATIRRISGRLRQTGSGFLKEARYDANDIPLHIRTEDPPGSQD